MSEGNRQAESEAEEAFFLIEKLQEKASHGIAEQNLENAKEQVVNTAAKDSNLSIREEVVE